MFQIDANLPRFDKDYDEGPDRWIKQQKLEEIRDRYTKDQMATPFTETTLGTKVLHALMSWRDEREGRHDEVKPPPIHDDSELSRYSGREQIPC